MIAERTRVLPLTACGFSPLPYILFGASEILTDRGYPGFSLRALVSKWLKGEDK